MQKNGTYIEKISINDFRKIEFPLGRLPRLAVELIKTMCKIDIEKIIKERKEKKILDSPDYKQPVHDTQDDYDAL